MKTMSKRFLLLSLLATPLLANAVQMETLNCQKMHITSSTTLAQVQAKCLISKQYTKDGRYAVKFRNDDEENKGNVTCFFGSNTPEAVVNGCR